MSMYINPTKFRTNGLLQQTPYLKSSLVSFWLTLSPFCMATLSSISLIFILVLVFSTPTFEARKMPSLKKGEVSSMEESLELASFLPKVPKPASSSSSSDDEGHARVVNINGRFFTLHLLSINDHRILEEAIPSPGVGHHRILEESIPSPGVGHHKHQMCYCHLSMPNTKVRTMCLWSQL